MNQYDVFRIDLGKYYLYLNTELRTCMMHCMFVAKVYEYHFNISVFCIQVKQIVFTVPSVNVAVAAAEKFAKNV